MAIDLPEPLRDEIYRFRDRYNVPLPLLLNLAALLLAPGTPVTKLNQAIRTVVSGVEDVVRRGSRKFALNRLTQLYFDTFIEHQPNFPYAAGYKTVTFYHGAHTGGFLTGMTFQDRVYLGWRPRQVPAELAAVFHEYVHTFQYKRFGLVPFIEIYVGNFLGNLVREALSRGPNTAYEDIRFEAEAFGMETPVAAFLDNPVIALPTRLRPLDPTALA